MKILLTAINSKFIHSNLAVRYLKAFTKDMDAECKIREFSINDREERVLEEIIKEKPNVVCFSTYIWNVEMVKRLSDLIKQVDSNIEILYGGPEVSYDSMVILEEISGDYIIEGEGEKTFREFVEYKLGIKDIESIRGLFYKKNGKVNFNGSRPLMSMDELVFPYEDDEDLNNKIVYYEASRGCPFNCKYCLSSTIHGVRFHKIDRVIEELNYFIEKKVKLVKFVDRTFNCNHKFSMAIWKFLIESNTETQFHFEISADILKNEEIELLREAPEGRFQFEVGVQTTNDEVLSNINRFVNFSDIKEKVVELLSIRNIKQHLDLIAGLPGEDYDSFRKSFNDVHSIHPEEIQLGFLKLLKGSSMREESDKYNMKYSPYPPYEILSTNKISYFELIDLKKVEHMVDKYYNSQKFNNILNYFYPKFKEPFELFHELAMFYDKKGYFNRSIGSNEYYKLFLDFNEEVLKENNFILREIIRYDYLLHNKRRGIPDYIKSNITKEEERKIKDELREEYSFRDYSVEKFYIDIIKFIEEDKILESEVYALLDNDKNFIMLNN
ncbi:B12-binding domain-containing radical SAM protein [Clostridium sp.]|uniref:B12-binding domain-containing radical SAM protein n=1 Tax=Clostridium sp. TaxID=1506 RepID=UPI0026DC8460|nr:B12-binding domain-containing radical SAM protein [Clostridium sp.]MDO5039713.1 B12-binding domain-containing radical SAM protein [Clostridium sp.]